MADEKLVDGGSGGRAQQRRVRKDGWTKPRRERFLKALAETCNVRISTARAGISAPSAYALRRRDPAFAKLWDDALEMGYDRLEALLLQRALEAVNDIDVDALIDVGDPDVAAAPAAEDAAAAPVAPGRRPNGQFTGARLSRDDVQLALSMLNRRGAKEGLRARGRKLMSSDEVDALLTKKLDALIKRRNRE